MSLSDCERCWDTPCTCGWYFESYSDKELIEFISSIFTYIKDENRGYILNEVKEKVSKMPVKKIK